MKHRYISIKQDSVAYMSKWGRKYEEIFRKYMKDY